MPPPHRSRTRDLIWLVFAIVASSAWCLTAGARLGATFDEPVYLQRGLEGWRTDSHRGLLRLGTMPLPADIQTLPLYLIECARGQPWDLEREMAAALAVARTMTLPFWWLLLIYGWLAGRTVAGSWGGNLAVAFLACEPNLLAHASLATTDIAVTACLLAFLVHYRQGRDRGTFHRIAVPGIWYGVALVAKASAMVFGPLCMLALEVERWLTRRDSDQTFPLQRFITESFQIGVIGFAFAFVFCGCDWLPEPSFVAWAHGLPDGIGKSAAVWLSDNLRIFSNAGEGLARQIKHNLRGHGTFLLGTESDRAFWYYFPVLLSIKLAVPFLITPLILLAIRARSLCNWPLMAAGFLFLFSFNCRVQIGVRLVLPCVALAAIGLAAATANASISLAGTWRAATVRWSALLGVGWMVIGTLAVWPDGLRFVNEIWGGRANAYTLVSDSNYDWGQGLPELARWKERHGIERLDVWYFGTDPALRRLPLNDMPFHVLSIQSPEQVREIAAGRILAVGTSVLYGHGLTMSHRRAASYLRTCTPVARTSTFVIFDFSSVSASMARDSQTESRRLRDSKE
jgi:hypothetical protein